MELDEKTLGALKRAVTAIDKTPCAMPTDVLEPLIEIARPGVRVRLDVAASDVVGVPVVSVEKTAADDILAPLTARQRQVALLVIDGLSNRQIASQLGISIATVKDHVHAILVRLNLPSRVALIAASRI